MPDQGSPSDRASRGPGSYGSAERTSAPPFLYDPEEAGGPFVPGELLGERYRYERTLSEGGMAVVVGAHHVELGERVAMKFIKPAYLASPDLVARFAREAKTTARIRSEHTVQALDVGVDRRRGPFLVMEYLEGRDLKAFLESEGPLESERAAEIGIQVCDALAAAHAQGVVHRDVKPDNIFLLQRGGFETVRVLDFGISKAPTAGPLWNADASLVRTALLLGSPLYMSPEQMRSSANVDHRSDVWSLGVTLYEVLCGEPPFAAPSITETCALVLETEPRPLAERNPSIDPGLAGVVMGCLRKLPDDRPQSVAELALSLLPYAPPRARLSVERVVAMLNSPSGPLSTPPAPRTSWRPSTPPARGSGFGAPLAETMAEMVSEAPFEIESRPSKMGGAPFELESRPAKTPPAPRESESDRERTLRRRRRLGLALACLGGVSFLVTSAFALLEGGVVTSARLQAVVAPKHASATPKPAAPAAERAAEAEVAPNEQAAPGGLVAPALPGGLSAPATRPAAPKPRRREPKKHDGAGALAQNGAAPPKPMGVASARP
ncbi:MAG: serine/threonine protein kinase, partial [Polyangiaceae bacterium]|nr:serine/threonine protein kinase [Polyangiaceae bacterium]